ncbi:hypothetical protein LTR17_010235 [Elasticomyces elasticus]|nr:hypothetical protein LTR17_010235 [Elasticomyces elasticus]
MQRASSRPVDEDDPKHAWNAIKKVPARFKKAYPTRKLFYDQNLTEFNDEVAKAALMG